MPVQSTETATPVIEKRRRPRKPDLRRHTGFRSDVLGNVRDLIVYMPPGYRRIPFRDYPVLYMQDGQNLFDPATSFIPGVYWRLGETADALIRSGKIEPLIIVGIYNTENRIYEYTPSKDRKLGGGGAGLYRRMLLKEVQPFIDAHYRTMKEPSNTAVGGSSLGGLVSLYVGLRSPAVFGKLAIMSPSVWWGGGAILKTLERWRASKRPQIWLDIGAEEGRKAVRDARRLRRALSFEGWKEGKNMKYAEFPGAQHNENYWAQRVGSVLEYLFPGPKAGKP